MTNKVRFLFISLLIFSPFYVYGQLSPSDKNDVPPGFENIEQQEVENYLDVYFLGRPVTTAWVKYNQDYIEIQNLNEVIDSLEGITNKALVKKHLSGKIKNHYTKACPSRSRRAKKKLKNCGLIDPKIAGVILDKSNFTLTIFINSSYLEKSYQSIQGAGLPPSSSGFSFLHDVDAYLNDTKTNQVKNFNMKTLLGYKESYIDMDSSIYKSNLDKNRRRYNINELQAKINKNNKKYYAGWGQAVGSSFLQGKRYLGLGMETTTDQIIDQKSLYSSAVELFLETPSKVEIYKDGKLLSAQDHDGGYIMIDTSNFPSGSYDTLIRIEDQNGNITEKTEYFVKRTSMPPLGKPQYYFNVGYLQETFDKNKKMLPTYSKKLLLQAGGSYRTSLNTYLSENIMVARGGIFSETGFNYIATKYSVTPTGYFSTHKDLGAGINYNTSFFNKIRFSINAAKSLRKHNPNQTDPRYDPLSSLRYRISTSLSFPVWEGNLSYRYRLHRNFNQEVDHINIIRYQYNWRLSQLFRASLGSTITYKSNETVFLLNMAVRFSEKNFAASVNNTRTYSKQKGQSRTYKNVYGLNTNWNKQDQEKKYRTSLAIDKEYDKDRVNTRVSYQDNLWTINPSLNYFRSSGKPNHSRSLRVSTGLVFTDEAVSFTNTKRAKQGVLVTVKTMSKIDGKFEVYLNGRPVQVISGNNSIFVNAQPYKTYKISVVSQSKERFEIKEKMKMATIYPGNVAQTTFNAYQIYALMSKLVDETDTPISNASLEGGRFFDQTDESGNFQFDIRADQKKLVFKKQSGEKCMAVIPDKKIDTGFLEIPKLVCRDIPGSGKMETENKLKIPSGKVEVQSYPA